MLNCCCHHKQASDCALMKVYWWNTVIISAFYMSFICILFNPMQFLVIITV